MNYQVFTAEFTRLGNLDATDDLEAMKLAKAKYPAVRGVMVERDGILEFQRRERELERLTRNTYDRG